MNGISRRGRILLAGVIALILGTDVTMVYLRQPAAPVGADVALERFRSATPEPQEPTGTEAGAGVAVDPVAGAPTDPAAPPGAPGEPAPGAPAPAPDPAAPAQPAQPAQPAGPLAPPPPPEGVYAYKTTGYEEVDAFGGSRHDYPATTYMTIRKKGCGIVLRWQPLEERWDESDHCVQGANITIDRFAMYHEFFQSGMEQPYPCVAGSHVYRAGQPPGASWKVRCSSPEFGDVDMTTSVVGTEPVDVGGTVVQAVRMHYEAKITGYSQGTQIQDRWIDPDRGLMLRIVTSVDVNTKTPIGQTPYRERYRIDLLSLTPQT